MPVAGRAEKRVAVITAAREIFYLIFRIETKTSYFPGVDID
jgi:hypothetical protein